MSIYWVKIIPSRSLAPLLNFLINDMFFVFFFFTSKTSVIDFWKSVCLNKSSFIAKDNYLEFPALAAQEASFTLILILFSFNC